MLPSGPEKGRSERPRGTRPAAYPQAYVIRTAAVDRSTFSNALPSNRSSELLLAPAFSSNLCSDTGPAYNLAYADESSTTGFARFLLTRTLHPKMLGGPNCPAPNTYAPGQPAVPPLVSKSSVSLFAGVNSNVSAL